MTATFQELQTLRKIFWYAAFLLIAVVALYGYIVNQVVYKVAEREKTQAEISSVHSELSELEFKYITQKNRINPEYAYSLGFKNVESQHFISAKGNARGGLSLKTIE